MKIAFTDIQAFGDKENERIRFKVTEACNLGDYLIALSEKKGNGRISSKLEHIKWLSGVDMNANDWVIVYSTRKGNGVKQLRNEDGSSSFFVFWNLEHPLTEFTGKSVVYIEAFWNTINFESLFKEDTEEGEEGQII